MSEILGKIGFDWQVALANFINFVIIFFILKKFAFEPIQKVISDRQKKIDQGLEDAKRAETNLLISNQLREDEINKAKLESNKIIGSAQEKGNEILAKAETESVDIKKKTLEEGNNLISEKKNNLKKEVEKESALLIVQGIEKIMREKLTAEEQEKYIKRTLQTYNTTK